MVGNGWLKSQPKSDRWVQISNDDNNSTVHTHTVPTRTNLEKEGNYSTTACLFFRSFYFLFFWKWQLSWVTLFLSLFSFYFRRETEATICSKIFLIFFGIVFILVIMIWNNINIIEINNYKRRSRLCRRAGRHSSPHHVCVCQCLYLPNSLY